MLWSALVPCFEEKKKAENCLKRLVTGVAPAALCTDFKAVFLSKVVQPLRLT
jgi:hypothetical protein